jgi:predicted alpha/beta-hydrolase family hydrolase
MPESTKIKVPDGGTVTGLIYRSPEKAAHPTIILGHGAGAPQTSRFMVDFAGGLAARGCHAVTFNFPYTEHGRKIPDRGDKLETCYRAVVDAVRAASDLAGGGLIIGGKSMGGRIASQVAASGCVGVKGLVLFGYPLHPPGRPERLRAEHLALIRLPMLFVQGSRDAFGTPEELRPIIDSLLPPPQLYCVEDGDHSFKVPRQGSASQDQVYRSVLDEAARWSIDLAADR